MGALLIKGNYLMHINHEFPNNILTLFPPSDSENTFVEKLCGKRNRVTGM